MMPETQIAPEPVWTRRVLLTHTLKDGWRVAEVSVSVTGDVPGGAIQQALFATHEEGADALRDLPHND